MASSEVQPASLPPPTASPPSEKPGAVNMSSPSPSPPLDDITPATTAASRSRLPTLEHLDYTPGTTLPLRVDPAENNEQFPEDVEVKIQKAIEPRTMSCGMIVQIKEKGKAPRQAFLKIYDRRLSPHFREYFNGGECHCWTPEIEEQYMDALRNDGLPIGEQHFDNDQMTEERWNKLSIAEKEHAFQQRMRKIHHDEKEAYRRLIKHQGAEIPKLYASVCVGCHAPETGSPDVNEKYGHLLEIRGLLLEYINGWELLSVPSNLYLRTATKLFEEALAIIRMIGTHGVLNYDVKLDNFMVAYDHHHGSHRVCMIDLGFSHFRHKSWSSAEWAKLKALAWDGEVNQMIMEAQRVVRKRFDADLPISGKSEYGFLACQCRTTPARCPAGWLEMRTSRGPAYVNPVEQVCEFPCCRPHKDKGNNPQREGHHSNPNLNGNHNHQHRDLLGDVKHFWRKIAHHHHQHEQGLKKGDPNTPRPTPLGTPGDVTPVATPKDTPKGSPRRYETI